MRHPTTIPLGEKIRQVRIAKELTQDYLARALNYSNTHISRIEKGTVECDSETLDAIKIALAIPKATPLTEDELTVYKSQIWVWHEQLNSHRINDAQAMKGELECILYLPFENDLKAIYMMQAVRLLYIQEAARVYWDNKESHKQAIEQLLENTGAILETIGDEASPEARYLYHRNMGAFYGWNIDYKEAINHSIKAAELYKFSSILKPDSLLYSHISFFYLNLGKPHHALLYLERAFAADSNDPTSTNGPLLKVRQAGCYIFLGELEKSKAIYEESLARARSINNKELIVMATVDLGDVAARMGRPKEAIRLLCQAESMLDGNLNVHASILFMYVKARSLLQIKHIKECEKVIEDGISLAREIGSELYIVCFESLRHLINIKNPESQEYLEKVAIPYLRNSNSIMFYETLEICNILERFYIKNRSKAKAMNVVAVSRDILYGMLYDIPQHR